MTRNRTRIGTQLASAVAGLALMFTVACATEGRPGARSGDDAKLSSEQRANLERYQKRVCVVEQHTRAREFEKALKALSDAEILAGRVYGPDRAIFAKTQARFGRVYTAMGRFELAALYRRTQRYPQAERYYAQARKVAEEAKQFRRRDIYLAQIDAGLAMVYARSKRPKEAETLFKRALEVFAKSPKVLANHAVRCHIQLARMYRANKDLKQAQSQVRTALSLASQHLGPRSYAYARSLSELAEVYVAQKARDHAATLLRQAFDLTRQAFGADHPRTQRIRQRLVALYRALGWQKKIRDLAK